MSHPRKRMNFRQVLGVGFLCGVLSALLLIGAMIVQGVFQGNDFPILKVALVWGVMTAFVAMTACLAYFWSGEY